MRGVQTVTFLLVLALPTISAEVKGPCQKKRAKTVKRFADGRDIINALSIDRPHSFFKKGEKGDMGFPGVKGERGECSCRSTRVLSSANDLMDDVKAEDGDLAIVGADELNELWLKAGNLWMKLAVVDTRPSTK
jgi:hypothetical protein